MSTPAAEPPPDGDASSGDSTQDAAHHQTTRQRAQPAGQQGPQDAARGPDTAAEGREAAKYRRQLREAEKARDELAERLNRYTRKDVETLAADKMANPEDLWIAGVELSELLDEVGEVDGAKVVARVDAVLKDRPHWRAQGTDYDGGARESPAPAASWSDVIAAGRKRSA